MATKVFDVWYRLVSSFWFIPALMVVLAIVLWYLMGLLDTLLGTRGISFWWVFSGGIDGARSILATVAGSIITVAGVVFSITIVVLSQSSSQFGPQVLKSFMRDRSTQIALGTFVATFVYSLLILGTLRGISGDSQPQAGTTMALVLALASIGVLIMFIHSMARSVQANNIVASIVREMDGSMSRVFPVRSKECVLKQDEQATEADIPEDFDDGARHVPTLRNGFLQVVETEKLVQIAAGNELILKIKYNPGQFIPWKGELAAAWPKERVDAKTVGQIQKAFVLGDERTTEQDIGFSIERLAMIAVRALSPGINDLYTATLCIDWLGVVLCQLAERSFSRPYRYDSAGKLRIITRPLLLSVFVDAAFNEIRHSANSPDVLINILKTLGVIARYTRTTEHRSILLRHAREIEFNSRKKLAGNDLRRIQDQFSTIARAIEFRIGVIEEQR